MKKIKTRMEIAMEWCREHNVSYADYQQMMTLGYIEERWFTEKDYKIVIVDKENMEHYFGRK